MDQATLDKIKAELENKKEELEKELSAFATKDGTVKGNYKSNFPDFGNDEDENASEVADYDARLGIEHTLEKHLRDVNKALKSIEEGTYGDCKYCKQPIEPERLMIRPDSGSCVDCKKKLQGEA